MKNLSLVVVFVGLISCQKYQGEIKDVQTDAAEPKISIECHEFILNQIPDFIPEALPSEFPTELTTDELTLLSDCSYAQGTSHSGDYTVFGFQTVENGKIVKFEIGVNFNYDRDRFSAPIVAYKASF